MKHTHTHSHAHLSQGEASYVRIFSHCSSGSLSPCRPASAKMEEEKDDLSGWLCETEEAALSFLFARSIVAIFLSVNILSAFTIRSYFIFVS